MPLSLLNHSAHALFAQRTRIPTSARSIGICVIWVCISSSFLPCRRMELLDRKRRNSSPWSLNTSRLLVCSVCAIAIRTLTRLGTPHGSRHSGVNGFPLQLQLQMRPSLTASYRGILLFCKMALLLLRRHLTLDSSTTSRRLQVNPSTGAHPAKCTAPWPAKCKAPWLQCGCIIQLCEAYNWPDDRT